MTRAINPTGSMLLDRSSAQPGSIDKSVFEKKSGSSSASTGQGTVNPNYLKECREDNPEPAATQDQTKSVALGTCKITTAPEDLVVDQPFEMSVEAKNAAGPASGQATFRLFCTIPDPAGGPPKCEDQSLSFSGKVVDGLAKASGKLISPKKPVPAGTKLQYHVVAEHPDAKEKCESPKVEVVSGKPPKPLAVWSLGAVHFGFDSSFILPSAAAKIAEFKDVIAKHQGAAVAVFGHADPVGEDDANKGLSGRRAFAVYCLLSKDPTGWTQLANSDKWDLRTTQTMLTHLKDKASGAPYYGGSIDGKTGPKTESAIKTFRADHSLGNGTTLDGKSKEGLYKAYMESVCEVTCKPEDFVGDPKDPKRQWACVGCSEFNPVLVFGKEDDAKFRNASDKTERNAKNAPNRRATVFLFPPGAKGPGNVEFPCPQWSEGVSACRKQFFEDADKRRNPSDTERTWEKDKDTFACKFYAELGEANQTLAPESFVYKIRLLRRDLTPVQPGTRFKIFADQLIAEGQATQHGIASFQTIVPIQKCSIEWNENPSGDESSSLTRDCINLDTFDGDDTHRKLENLGYLLEDPTERVKAFQRDAEIEQSGESSDVSMLIRNWHDLGIPPRASAQDTNSSLHSFSPRGDGLHAPSVSSKQDQAAPQVASTASPVVFVSIDPHAPREINPASGQPNIRRHANGSIWFIEMIPGSHSCLTFRGAAGLDIRPNNPANAVSDQPEVWFSSDQNDNRNRRIYFYCHRHPTRLDPPNEWRDSLDDQTSLLYFPDGQGGTRAEVQVRVRYFGKGYSGANGGAEERATHHVAMKLYGRSLCLNANDITSRYSMENVIVSDSTAPPNSHTHNGNPSSPSQIFDAVDRWISRHGNLDHLVIQAHGNARDGQVYLFLGNDYEYFSGNPKPDDFRRFAIGFSRHNTEIWRRLRGKVRYIWFQGCMIGSDADLCHQIALNSGAWVTAPRQYTGFRPAGLRSNEIEYLWDNALLHFDPNMPSSDLDGFVSRMGNFLEVNRLQDDFCKHARHATTGNFEDDLYFNITRRLQAQLTTR